MKAQYWLEKWQTNDIGFHNDEIHELLKATWSRLGLESDTRVLVPLCGKSRDMMWLADQGHNVIGVELSDTAAKVFFQENRLTATVSEDEGFVVYKAQQVTIIVGDFFAVTQAHVGKVDAIYDRAALVALPASERQKYISQCANLGGNNHKTLLVSLEYLPEAIVPPPFSLLRSAVEDLFSSDYSVDHLETIPAEVKGFPARESAYRLTRKFRDIEVDNP